MLSKKRMKSEEEEETWSLEKPQENVRSFDPDEAVKERESYITLEGLKLRQEYLAMKNSLLQEIIDKRKGGETITIVIQPFSKAQTKMNSLAIKHFISYMESENWRVERKDESDTGDWFDHSSVILTLKPLLFSK